MHKTMKQWEVCSYMTKTTKRMNETANTVRKEKTKGKSYVQGQSGDTQESVLEYKSM